VVRLISACADSLKAGCFISSKPQQCRTINVHQEGGFIRRCFLTPARTGFREDVLAIFRFVGGIVDSYVLCMPIGMLRDQSLKVQSRVIQPIVGLTF